MEGDACPIPTPKSVDEADAVNRMLAARRIVIVGLSDDPSRPSYGIGEYLRSVGKEIVPVNPNLSSWKGIKAYPALEDVPGKIDLVNVFRRSEFCAAIGESAVKIHAGGLWLQSGVINPDAKRIAEEAGIDFVQNRCIMVEHMRRGR